MTLFDLLFIAAFLGSAVALARGLVLILRGRWTHARRSLVRLAAFAAAYGLVLVVVSLFSPGKTVPMGAEQRFDDWAIAVTGVTRADRIGDAPAEGAYWIVSVRVSSHARRRRQRETDVHPYLIDARGRRYEVSGPGQAALERLGEAGPALTSFLDPGASFDARLAFDVPREATGLAFVKENHDWFPARLIIGDPASALHKPTRVPLTPRP